MVKDTKIKGTIKYVLFFYCFTGKLCISLRSTQSPRHQKMILEGTLCLISTPGSSPVQPGLYSTQEGSLMVPLSSYWLGDMGLNPGGLIRCPGWLPPLPLDLVSPQEGFSLGPLTPRFKRFPAIRFLCFLFGIQRRTFMRNHPPIGGFY